MGQGLHFASCSWGTGKGRNREKRASVVQNKKDFHVLILMIRDQINTTGAVKVKDHFPNTLQLFCEINQASFGQNQSISTFKLAACNQEGRLLMNLNFFTFHYFIKKDQGTATV